MNMRIVVPDDYPAVFGGSPAEQRLRALGELTIHSARGAGEESELARRIGDAEIVLGLRASSHYTARVLDDARRLRLLSIWGTGTDNVDLDACRRRGITVTNTAGVNAHAVAEHSLALMLAVARRIPSLDGALRAGEWPRARLTGLDGKTLGVVGLGAIGQRVAVFGAALGMSVLIYAATDERGRAAALGATALPFDDMLRASDVVSLHLRLTPETEGILDRRRLALMKPGAILVNTARGKLVDRLALLEALRTGQLGGAGLDVFHEEPLPPDDALRALPNAVLTPHCAGSTHEAVEAGLERAVDNIESFVRGEPRNVVVSDSA